MNQIVLCDMRGMNQKIALKKMREIMNKVKSVTKPCCIRTTSHYSKNQLLLSLRYICNKADCFRSHTTLCSHSKDQVSGKSNQIESYIFFTVYSISIKKVKSKHIKCILLIPYCSNFGRDR